MRDKIIKLQRAVETRPGLFPLDGKIPIGYLELLLPNLSNIFAIYGGS
jgi:hypothetical protein